MPTATETPKLSRDVQRQLIQTVLSEHERNLLRMEAQGKSHFSIARLYRQYGDERGVRDALDRIRAKLTAAAERRAEQSQRPTGLDVPVELAANEAAGIEPGESAADREVTLPSKAPSGSNGSMAEPAPEPTERSASLPPTAPAPAPVPSSSNGGTPAPRTERQRIVLALLAKRRMSKRAIEVELGIANGGADAVMTQLTGMGLVVRTEENAKDWPGAESVRRPSRVYRLAHEPEGCGSAPNAVPDRHGDYPSYARPSKSKPRAPASTKLAPTSHCEHGAPHTLCRVCSPALPMEGTASAPAKLDRSTIDIEELWAALGGEQKIALMRKALDDLETAYRE